MTGMASTYASGKCKHDGPSRGAAIFVARTQTQRGGIVPDYVYNFLPEH